MASMIDDKMMCHYMHNVIIKLLYNDSKMIINISSHIRNYNMYGTNFTIIIFTKLNRKNYTIFTCSFKLYTLSLISSLCSQRLFHVSSNNNQTSYLHFLFLSIDATLCQHINQSKIEHLTPLYLVGV
jgi:hypothetical protein